MTQEPPTSLHRSRAADGTENKGDRSITNAPLLSSRRASRDILRDFLYRLIAFVKAHRLYRSGHTRLQIHLETLREQVHSIFELQDTLSIFIQPDAVYVSGERFGEEEAIVAAFIPELVKRLIRYVILEPGVTVEELNALARLMSQDPKVLRAAGDLHEALAGLLGKDPPEHLRVVELHYHMEAFVQGEGDLQIVRSLARFGKGTESEPHVMRRLGALDIKEKEKQRLLDLLSQPEVVERLEALKELFTQLPTAVRERIHTTDMMVHLARGILKMEAIIGVKKTESTAGIAARVLDRIHEEFLAALSDTRDLQRRDLLDRIARSTTSSPDALLKWLSIDAERLNVVFSPDQAGMIRAFFSRWEGGDRKIGFGETELRTLHAPPSGPSRKGDARPDGRKNEKPDPGVTELEKRYARLELSFQNEGWRPEPESVARSHMDVLTELLRQETDPKARERILEEMGRFLGRYCDARETEPEISSFLMNRFERLIDRLEPQEAAAAARPRTACHWMLRGYLLEGKPWREALRCACRSSPASFAAALGKLLLKGNAHIPLEEVREFLPGCQDKLVDWLLNRLRNEEEDLPLRRTTAIVLALRTSRMVPLVEVLLEKSTPKERPSFLHVLTELDNHRSLQLLARYLEEVEHASREEILIRLGDCRNLLAERILLDHAKRLHLNRKMLKERTSALSALYKCGTEYSRETLEGIARNILLLFVPGGRTVRLMASGAVESIEYRRYENSQETEKTRT